MTVGPRIFVSFLLVIGVGLLTATIALSSLLSSYENDVTRARLQDLAAPFVLTVQNGFRDFRRPAVIVDSLAEQARAAGARLMVLDAQRRVIVDMNGSLLDQRLPA